MSAMKRISVLDMNSLKIVNLGTPTASTDAVTKTYVDTASSGDRARGNHTGTQVAATISDFNAAVQAIRLDQMAAPTTSVSLNGQKIVSVLDPASAQDAATKNYVDSQDTATRSYVDTQIAGLVSGQTLKGSVRVVTTTNVTLSAPGASLDGVAMAVGEIFLATGQTTGSQNGPYVWNGAAVAATRATNWDSSGEAVLGSYWIVREGTKADNFALLTNDTTITLDTTIPVFAFFSAASAVSRYSADLDLGNTPRLSFTKTIAWTGVTVGQTIMCSPSTDYPLSIRADEYEMAPFVVAARVSATDTIEVIIHSVIGAPIAGRVRVNILV